MGKPISSLKLIVPVCQRRSQEILPVADTFQKSSDFPSTLFFLKKKNQLKQAPELSIIRAKEKA